MAAPSTTRAGAETRPCTSERHTSGTYSKKKCRCPIGREARRLYLKRLREGRNPAYWVDATGARRRIQGLMSMRWPCEMIAKAAGLSAQQHVFEIATQRIRLTRATDDAIRRAAAVLGDRPGPSAITARRAARRGYVPLWAWDEDTIDDPDAQPMVAEPVDVDEVAVARALHAARAALPPAPLTPAELAIVAPKLAGAPYYLTDRQIGERLGIGPHRARRRRVAAGVQPATIDQQKAAA